MHGMRPVGGPFTMTEMTGHRVTEADLRGRPSVLFFGFTGCPSSCPTTLTQLTAVLGRMGAEADRLNAVFVTVDPERDTPEQMRAYLSSFDPRIRGFIGTPAELAAMAAAYGVQYRREPLEGGDYTLEHTAALLLLDAHGRVTGAVPYGSTDQKVENDLERLIGTKLDERPNGRKRPSG